MILYTCMTILQLCATGAAPQDFAIPLAGVIYQEYLPYSDQVPPRRRETSVVDGRFICYARVLRPQTRKLGTQSKMYACMRAGYVSIDGDANYR